MMQYIPKFGTKIVITNDVKGYPMGTVGVVWKQVEETEQHSAGAILAFPDGESLYVSLSEMTTDLTWLPPRDQKVQNFVSNVLAREYRSQNPKKDRVARYLIENIDRIRAEHDATPPGPRAIEGAR